METPLALAVVQQLSLYMKRKLVTATHNALRKHSGAFKIRVVLFLLIIVCGKAWALDQFEGIKCAADIPKSLVGKRDSNERVVVLEQRHKDLGLKDLGGTEITDRLFLSSWQICGREYELLVNKKNGLIRDVLPFPPHSAASPCSLAHVKRMENPSPSWQSLITAQDTTQEMENWPRRCSRPLPHGG